MLQRHAVQGPALGNPAWATVDVTVLGLVGGAPGGERMVSFVDRAVTLGRADDPPLLDTVHLRRPSIEMV